MDLDVGIKEVELGHKRADSGDDADLIFAALQDMLQLIAEIFFGKQVVDELIDLDLADTIDQSVNIFRGDRTAQNLQVGKLVEGKTQVTVLRLDEMGRRVVVKLHA
mgnify:CR=1 FL=1